MSAVRIEGEAFEDDRFDRLAEACDLADADHARGKMLRLWRQCTIEQTYTLNPKTIERVLGSNGVSGVLEAGLAVRVKGGKIRIRGTRGRIEWLQKLRDNGQFGKLGGRPRKPTRVSVEGENENPDGFREKTPLAPSPSPSQEIPERESPPTRDPQSTEPAVRSTGNRDVETTALASVIWTRHVGEYDELRKQFAPEMPGLAGGTMPIGWRDLRERIRGYADQAEAEKACLHVLAIRRSEAERSRSLRWFGHTVWREDQFARALSTPRNQAPAARVEREPFVPHFPFTLPEDA